MADSKVPTMADARLQASSVLFAVAVVQLVCGFVGRVIVPLIFEAPFPDEKVTTFSVTWFGSGVVFGLLGLWARVRPLPPTIVGLLLYVGIFTANGIIDPETIATMILVKIVVVLALVLAVVTCLNATPDDPADTWAEGGSGPNDWDGRSTGKRHDPDKDGYS
jgi:hypothetical protein